jgi:hypothetical protein
LEESYELKDNGEIKTRSARLRTLSNLRFAFSIFGKSQQIDFAIDTSGTEWTNLVNSLKVRDRLTHPKNASDLCVSDDEIRQAVTSMFWFESQMVELLLQCAERLVEQQNKSGSTG